MLALQRLPAFVAAGATFLFLVAFLHQQQPSTTVNFLTSSSHSAFLEIAFKHGSDKVATHSYQDMYEKYLPALRISPLRMLEIAPGCDAQSGPSASYDIWLEYFPHVELFIIESDTTCTNQWTNDTSSVTVVAGNPADVAFLNQFIEDTGGQFNLIVDNGGRVMNQQRIGLQELWKTIKPGGYYFCEDLRTSYMAARKQGEEEIMQFIGALTEEMTVESPEDRKVKFDGVEQVAHVDCSREICVLEKRKEEKAEVVGTE